MKIYKAAFLMPILIGFFFNYSFAQKNTEKTLFSTIMELDKQVFSAYNSCNLDDFEKFFTNDVEFFNSRSGYTGSRRDMMKSMKAVCENGGIQRELINVKIYPLDFYGAVETGKQRYYKVVNGKRQSIGTAQFTNIWKHDDDKWQIARVITYDHSDK